MVMEKSWNICKKSWNFAIGHEILAILPLNLIRLAFLLTLRNVGIRLESPHFLAVSAKCCELKMCAERRSWKI